MQKSNENSVEQHREAVRETAGLPEPAATERRRRQEVLKAKGWRVLPFRPTPPSGRPMAGVRHLGNGAWELSPEVWDHAYRLAHTSGRVLYVGEPSQLTAKALTQIQQLRDAGWRVAVRPHRALHYPGHTIAVHVQEPVTTVEKARTTKVFETLLEDLLYHGNGTWWTGCAGCGGNQMISGSAVWPACDPLFTPHVAGCVIARYLPTWRADARAHRGSVRLTRLAQCQPNDRQLEPDSREPA